MNRGMNEINVEVLLISSKSFVITQSLKISV